MINALYSPSERAAIDENSGVTYSYTTRIDTTQKDTLLPMSNTRYINAIPCELASTAKSELDARIDGVINEAGLNRHETALAT